MTTKDQERAALAKIRKIIDGLDKDSYIATAFDGCLEIAASNIENDWACSMKQKAESAEKEAERLKADNQDMRHAIKELKASHTAEITDLNSRIDELKKKLIGPEDLIDCIQLLDDAIYTDETGAKDAADEIIANAELPGSKAFQDAVRKHRNYTHRIEYYKALRGRLDRARFNAE